METKPLTFIVHTVHGYKFGPYKSENPYLEHKDAWGRAPREQDADLFPPLIVQKSRTSEFYHNGGSPIHKIRASPDYWIEIIKENEDGA